MMDMFTMGEGLKIIGRPNLGTIRDFPFTARVSSQGISEEPFQNVTRSSPISISRLVSLVVITFVYQTALVILSYVLVMTDYCFHCHCGYRMFS